MTTEKRKWFWQEDRRLRRFLLIVDVGLIAFWVYSVEYIIHHPVEKGSDGFEIFLAVPMTVIALCLNFPALLLLISNRTLKFAPPITLAAVVANVLFGSEILWNSGLRRGAFWPLW